jgi:hypothetical protein
LIEVSPMDQKPKIEIEDLLKLKKLERPAPEFWDQFDQGLRRKSMEALVSQETGFWQRTWERKGFQQVAVAAALVMCAVPAYMGVQSYQAETPLHEVSLVAVQASQDSKINHQEFQQRVVETTRELAMRKENADNMRFVVDSYAVDPAAYRFENDVWVVGEDAWRQNNRTYVNDRVKLLPEGTAVLPINLSY